MEAEGAGVADTEMRDASGPADAAPSPQVTREVAYPHVYMRLELEWPDESSQLNDKVLRAVLSKALTQFLGKSGPELVDVLHTRMKDESQQPADVCSPQASAELFVRAAKGSVEKVAAACACLTTYADRPVRLAVTGVATSLGKLAVSSRAYTEGHIAPLLPT